MDSSFTVAAMPLVSSDSGLAGSSSLAASAAMSLAVTAWLFLASCTAAALPAGACAPAAISVVGAASPALGAAMSSVVGAASGAFAAGRGAVFAGGLAARVCLPALDGAAGTAGCAMETAPAPTSTAAPRSRVVAIFIVIRSRWPRAFCSPRRNRRTPPDPGAKIPVFGARAMPRIRGGLMRKHPVGTRRKAGLARRRS